MINWFGYFKALHIVFMVSWFAGLFYMVRLFVYYSEADLNHKELSSAFKKQYLLMQKRLWYIISWPSMVLTIIFGGLMLYQNPIFLSYSWMHLKLTFVLLLIFYHIFCHYIFIKQQNNKAYLSSFLLRLWNEVATLFLVVIVFMVVLRNELNVLYGTIGFLIFAIVLFLAARWYKKFRSRWVILNISEIVINID